jgi:hypothetical protein
MAATRYRLTARARRGARSAAVPVPPPPRPRKAAWECHRDGGCTLLSARSRDTPSQVRDIDVGASRAPWLHFVHFLSSRSCWSSFGVNISLASQWYSTFLCRCPKVPLPASQAEKGGVHEKTHVPLLSLLQPAIGDFRVWACAALPLRPLSLRFRRADVRPSSGLRLAWRRI